MAGSVWERIPLSVLVYRGFLNLGAWLGRVGISANALTYGSVAFGGLACAAVTAGSFAFAALAVVLGGFCDALDGIVARSTGTVSRYGALLDSTVDRVTDALPLLGILLFYAERPTLALVPGLALIGAIVIPYVRARTEALGVTLPTLVMRRPERVVLLVVCLLMGELDLDLALGVDAPLMLVGALVLAVLNALGGVIVLRAARSALESSEVELPRRSSPQTALRGS